MPGPHKLSDSTRKESFRPDQDGVPIPILGFTASDAESVDASAAITTNTTLTLVVDALYMIVIAQADTTDIGILVVDIDVPAAGSKNVRMSTSSGQFVIYHKAIEVTMKITHVASPNSTGFIVSQQRLK